MSKDHTKEGAGRAHSARPAALVTRLLGLTLAAALLVPEAVAQGAPGCTVEQGQHFIEAGRYEHAIRQFTCIIDAQPTEVEGYRGRIEAELLVGRYSDALADYARVTAVVEPVHPDAHLIIRDAYAARLAIAPHDIPALTGASFERWADFDYAQALRLLEQLLDAHPGDPYGTLFRGSSQLLRGGPGPKERGEADLERALALAPESPDVRFIVADAYTYGLPDFERAFVEASLALAWGLDTPRVHAILATAYNAFGDLEAAAIQIDRHFELVTTETVATPPLPADVPSTSAWCRGGSTRSRSPRLRERRSRSPRAARTSGTPSLSCSPPTGLRSSAATTTTPTSRHSTGSPRKPAPTS